MSQPTKHVLMIIAILQRQLLKIYNITRVNMSLLCWLELSSQHQGTHSEEDLDFGSNPLDVIKGFFDRHDKDFAAVVDSFGNDPKQHFIENVSQLLQEFQTLDFIFGRLEDLYGWKIELATDNHNDIDEGHLASYVQQHLNALHHVFDELHLLMHDCAFGEVSDFEQRLSTICRLAIKNINENQRPEIRAMHKRISESE